MINFFRTKTGNILAVQSEKDFNVETVNALNWLFSESELLKEKTIKGTFIGPRREMITPWSTAAVEITRNMNIEGISRIEEFFAIEKEYKSDEEIPCDKMLQRIYHDLDNDIFTIDKKPDPIVYITDFEEYNEKEGLALSKEEIKYLSDLSKRLGRSLTDSEVFGFSQVNSEHCRHKIFNGTFIIDGKEMESTLFKMIKKTSAENPGSIVSAYKDNCAFLEGPKIKMFTPTSAIKPSNFRLKEEKTVISMKAETHNFPTTVEPFNGAATGSGGEIRDRMAGGKGSFPLSGTAVYMTAYPRLDKEHRPWENRPPRKWLYQSPADILIKASNGASDFGNKFGQPVICGSLLTFEHTEQDPDKNERKYGYDKVIMLAGGVGYAKKSDAVKQVPSKGDNVILLGGDNYRIGMGGGAVSSVATGEYNNAIELNAIQRSNPEMQKRVYNAVRALGEKDHNTIISIHDHGAGGHLNCLSELVEETGGYINIDKLPIGDPTLSDKEIIGNESQERMGLVMKQSDTEELRKIAERERAPFYNIGVVTGDKVFTLADKKNNVNPIDLNIDDMLGSTPKTIMTDHSPKGGWDGKGGFSPIEVQLSDKTPKEIEESIFSVLNLESVGCKDWLTNKVDRSVTGLIARQQCCGEIQLPISDLGVTALGFDNVEGIASSLGHAPVAGLIDPAAASRLSISEALTNIIWAPIYDSIYGVSLSANWMWPCKNEGENARLYKAVKGASDFAIAIGVNIPTGKDSMSMTQKYPDGEKVLSPGTLIISAAAQCKNVNNVIQPVMNNEEDSVLLYIPFVQIKKGDEYYPLGGSAYAQTISKIGSVCPDIHDPEYFKQTFKSLQYAMFNTMSEAVLAGHDISAGGIATTLAEMCFANVRGGADIDLTQFESANILLSEVPGVVVQVKESKKDEFIKELGNAESYIIGKPSKERTLRIKYGKKEDNLEISMNIDEMRDQWYKPSFMLDSLQCAGNKAAERYANYSKQPLAFSFPKHFKGRLPEIKERKIKAAIIRETGSNGDREMAWALYMAGFAVKDVHVTDLVSGRETLDDVQMIAFVGGFSNADTLGSAKGWAGALLYNEKARNTINRFYARKDTLSLGVCNGCQLMAELGLILPNNREDAPKMIHNDSHKYESGFIGVTVENSPSILLSSLQGSKLGIWVAHGEGKFSFPKPIENYSVALRYNYNAYPANPNGSPEGIAAICSPDGRHLAMMPHPERCLRPWNWAYYPYNRNDQVSPWIELFINGRIWIERQ